MNADDIEIDIERFVYEIQIRPGIWDLADAAYSKRDRKKVLWDEICDIFIEKEDFPEVERNLFGEFSSLASVVPIQGGEGLFPNILAVSLPIIGSSHES